MTEAAIRAVADAQPQAEAWGLIAVRHALAAEGRSRCLPFMKTAGLSDTLELVHAEPGLLRLRWTAEAPLDSYDGIVQGGMLAVIADVAQGHTFSTLLDAPCGFSTVDLSTRYIRPVPSGQTYEIECRVVEKTRQTALIETDIRNSDGKLTTHFLGSWRIANRDFVMKS